MTRHRIRTDRTASVLVGVLAGAIALSSCAANEIGLEAVESELAGTIVGTGASSQQAAQEVWVAGFQTANPDVTVNYDPVGSGAGRDTFMEGASDFAGSDRAFHDSELESGRFGSCTPGSGIVELPLYISPIAVVFNLDGIDRVNLDAVTLARMFTGEIENWSDEAIASHNPELELPDLRITPVHRSDDSGTTENFTEYLAAAAPEAWNSGADDSWPIPYGEAAQGTSGVIDAVRGGAGTIGYADASRAGDLGTVALQVGNEYVSYSPEAAAAIVDASPFVADRDAGDLAIELDRTSTAAGVYPLVLVSYLIGCEEYRDPGKGALVHAYFSHIASEEGQQAAAEFAGSAPISATLRDKVQGAIALIGQGAA